MYGSDDEYDNGNLSDEHLVLSEELFVRRTELPLHILTVLLLNNSHFYHPEHVAEDIWNTPGQVALLMDMRHDTTHCVLLVNSFLNFYCC